jgi:hypothetical protein
MTQVQAFSEPLEPMPVLNVVNAGRVIPVKWRCSVGRRAA